MINKRKLFLLFAGVSIWTANVQAQDKVWTFDDCVEWATTNNTEIRRTGLLLNSSLEVLKK